MYNDMSYQALNLDNQIRLLGAKAPKTLYNSLKYSKINAILISIKERFIYIGGEKSCV